ncbi:uncharacterized protein [Centruroides vittatus]|uniref:uncharacterized protein n=1 Tax=Centruroides vittatus TaxID=120091 RepID=UPI00350F3155
MFGKFRTIYHQEPHGPPKSGFVIVNDKIDVQLLPQYSNSSFTTISLSIYNSTYILISFYCPPSENLKDSLDMLADTVQQLQDHPILISGDFNAKSYTWHSPIKDPRGYMVEEFMTQLHLTSLNTSPLPTFSSTNGDSWIDICLGSSKIDTNKIQCYTIDLHSASDHNYIEIVIEQATPLPKFCIVQHTNWDLYYLTIQQLWKPVDLINIHQPGTLDNEINKLNCVIHKAYLQATTVKTVKCSAPWWNTDLDYQRTKLRKLKGRMRRELDTTRKLEIRSTYCSLFRAYKTSINKARSRHGGNFVPR